MRAGWRRPSAAAALLASAWLVIAAAVAAAAAPPPRLSNASPTRPPFDVFESWSPIAPPEQTCRAEDSPAAPTTGAQDASTAVSSASPVASTAQGSTTSIVSHSPHAETPANAAASITAVQEQEQVKQQPTSIRASEQPESTSSSEQRPPPIATSTTATSDATGRVSAGNATPASAWTSVGHASSSLELPSTELAPPVAGTTSLERAPAVTLVPPPASILHRDEDVSQVSDLDQPDGDLPEFPSFAEWKQRHLANAASSAFKESIAKKPSTKAGVNGGAAGSGHTAEVSDGLPSDVGRQHAQAEGRAPAPGGGSDHGRSRPGLPPGTGANSGERAGSYDAPSPDDATLSAATKPLIHPAPHAGSGDPFLDPLVQLRDRTNYASFDCSATLIRASKLTKSASAILSSKKDRYMLTPCSAKDKFVIIELCDEIQIDTVVLANLEFFSSMFKLFKVSAGTAYPESAGTWQELGMFRGSNVRGMQVSVIWQSIPPEPRYSC